MPGAVGEAGYGAGQVVGWVLGDGCGHAGGAQGNGHVADGHAQSQRCHGVVAAAGGEQAAAFDVLAGDGRIGLDGGGVARPQHGGQHDGLGVRLRGFGAFRGLEHHGDQVAAVFVRRGIVVDGAGGVGTVGEQRVEMGVLAFGDRTVAGDAPAQPIVGQADGGDFLGVFGLVLGHPCHLGQRVGGDGGGAYGLDPTLLASGDWVFRLAVLCGRCAELFDQSRSLGRRTGVVPQHRIADHIALVVEDHHAVLLAADGQRGYVVQAAGLLGGLLECAPPV